MFFRNVVLKVSESLRKEHAYLRRSKLRCMFAQGYHDLKSFKNRLPGNFIGQNFIGLSCK